MTGGPIERLKEILTRATRDGDEFANAAALATAGEDGRPAARMVLVKRVDEDGLAFFTNLNSRKAGQLRENPYACLCFWWPRYQIQVRVEGTVEPVGVEESDEYFAGRPRGSQLGAWASRQSEELADRAALERTFEEVSGRFRGRDVPRPPHWGGFRLRPSLIEFWHGRPDRLHERQVFRRRGGGWEAALLYP